jgi:hypothetical protein
VSVFRLTVWSVYEATPDAVFAHKSDVRALRDELLPFARMTVDDPEGLQRALRGAAPGRFRGKLCGPLGVVGLPWPFDIRASHPPDFYRDASVNALYTSFDHTHRVEAAGPGLSRYTDDVTFEPRFGDAFAAWVLRELFLHRHRRTALTLAASPAHPTRAWLRPGRGSAPAFVTAPA